MKILLSSNSGPNKRKHQPLHVFCEARKECKMGCRDPHVLVRKP